MSIPAMVLETPGETPASAVSRAALIRDQYHATGR